MKKMKKNGLIIIFWVILTGVSSFVWAEDSGFQVVEPDRIPEILEMLAAVTQDNYEKIKTWEGQIATESISSIRGEQASKILAEITDAKPDDSLDEIHRSGKRTVEYKIDMENNRFFSRTTSTEPYMFECPKSKAMYLPTIWKPEDRVQVVTSDHQIEIYPLSWRAGTVMRRQVTKNIHTHVQRTDPRNEFQIGGQMPWISLSRLSQSLQMTDIERFGVVLKESYEGDHILYQMEVFEPGKKHPFNIIVLSSEAGFNRTYIENRYDDGSLMSKTMTEFINIDSVFLPKRRRMSQYYQDGGLIRKESYVIVQQKINSPVGDDVFSELTYLQDNDRYQDRTRGKTYTVQAGKLVEEER